MSEYRPFPTDALPAPARSFVREGAAAIGVDDAFVALPLLAALGTAIGGTRRLLVKPGWAAPPILWAATVAESGTGKSPAHKLALAPLRAAQKQAFEEHAEAVQAFESEHARWKAERSQWEQGAKRNPGAAGDPPPEPDAPAARRYLVSDVTVEGLVPILQDNPRGVLLERDELAGWLGSFDRYAKAGRAGADAAHWLSMFDAESLTVDRKTGEPRTIHVPEAAVSVAGGIQPGVLQRAIGQQERESGLLSRLLVANPPPRPIVWTEATISANTQTKVNTLFGKLLDLRGELTPLNEERAALVTMDDEAKLAWVSFYNLSGSQQADLTGDLSAAWSKLRGYVPRFALIIHEVRNAAGDPTAGDPRRVDGQTMHAAIAIARWFEAETHRVYALLGESDDARESRTLVGWIERRGGSCTVRELTRGPREFRDSEKAQRALGELVSAGRGAWIEEAPGHGGGRPTTRFRLLPRGGDGDETPANPERIEVVSPVASVATATDAGDGWGEVGP